MKSDRPIEEKEDGSIELPAVLQGFDRIELSDGYCFDVPHEFLCPISSDLIAIPATDSIGLHLYEASLLASWLRIKSVSPLTNEPIRKRIVINQTFYDRMRLFFQELLQKDADILNDGKHAASLMLIKLHARGIQSDDKCIQDLTHFCRENKIKIKVPAAVSFFKKSKVRPVEQLEGEAQAVFGLQDVPLMQEHIARFPEDEVQEIAPPALRVSMSPPLSNYNWDRSSGDILLGNTVGIMTGWIVANRFSSMLAAYITLPTPFLVMLPFDIHFFNSARRPGPLLGLASGLVLGASTIAMTYALQGSQAVSWAPPVMNAVPAILTAALPSLCRSGSAFRSNMHGFWQRRREAPQPALESAAEERLARIV